MYDSVEGNSTETGYVGFLQYADFFLGITEIQNCKNG